MATTGTVLLDFVSQNAVIILVTGVLATFIALAAYYVVRVYLPSNNYASVNQEMQEESAEDKLSTQDAKSSGEGEEQPGIDPVYYCEHIQGEIKKVKQGVATRKICEKMSPEQMAEERKRQQDQLAEIFTLMQQQQDKFGISSMDEMHDQMRLYADIK